MYYSHNKIYLEEDSTGKVSEEKNFIEQDGIIFFLKYLNNEYKTSKGGNSSVFIIYNKDDTNEKIIKISNYSRPLRGASPKVVRRHGRFINEIKALYDLHENEYLQGYIIEIFFDGEIEINGQNFPYYVMEKSDMDLKENILKREYELDERERYKLCYDVLMAIKKLHHHGYYHRDIKPDNVFLFKNGYGDELTLRWKIGDLGLIAEREKDTDDLGERIGPFGWISPEAMNKYLTEKYDLGFDCMIDDKSDVFQLGSLFWFIFNYNAPIGIVDEEDFKGGENDLFDIINEMLNYTKAKRLSLPEVEYFLAPLCQF